MRLKIVVSCPDGIAPNFVCLCSEIALKLKACLIKNILLELLLGIPSRQCCQLFHALLTAHPFAVSLKRLLEMATL